MPLKSYTEDAPRALSDIVTLELNMSWCREPGQLAPAPEAVPMGAVLALNEDGFYAPYRGEADKAVAILISKDLPVNEEPQPCTVIRRGACVAACNLFWLPTVTEEQKKTALGQLSEAGIKCC